MAPKIGELLVSEGLLTRKQLDEALKSQVIFGGRLGTNLVEMGLLQEENLLSTLSKQLEMPYVTSEQLMSVPPEVIKLIARELVEEYKIIPLSLEKKRLTLAMADPADLSAIDAISFITGYIILPVVCSELRLILAMEQYYGIKREIRYIQLQGGTGARSRESAPVVQKEAAAKAEETSPFERGVAMPSAEDAEWGDLSEILPTKPNSQPPPEIFQQPAPLPPEEPDLVELVEEPLPEVQPAPQPAAQPAPTAKTVETAPSSLDAVLSILAEAKDRDAIADALAAHVGQEFERVALFMVKGKVAAGWKGIVRKKPLSQFDKFQLPLDELSVLKTVADTKSFYLGPILDTPGNKKLLAAIGGQAPETALLIPLQMMGRVVTIFYVDGGKDLGNKLFDLQKLTGKTSLAFEILILKNKILLA